MPRSIFLTVGAVALLTLGACGSRDAERSAPEAASLEDDATSDLTTGAAASNPGAAQQAGVAQTPTQQVDQGGQEGSSAPSPQ
ncbi:hypothetical protein D3C87_341450 [compost metagenome]